MSTALLKKGQQQMIMENIALIFIVLLLFITFMIFSTQLKSKDINEEQRKIENMRVAEIAQTMYGLHELQCSIGSYKENNCFDLLKIENFIGSEDYFDLFGYSTIQITYTSLSGITEEKILYAREKQNAQGKRAFFTPITVYNSHTKDNYYGILEIEAHS